MIDDLELATLDKAARIVGKTTHNIRDYIQRGRINKYNKNGELILKASNGDLRVSLKELKIFLSLVEIGEEKHHHAGLHPELGFYNLPEHQRTKHVHRLHPYKGKFIPQLVQYFIDDHIDDFKKVNDTYGHDCGDIILIEIANIFQRNIRLTDSVGRWGGEEFLFILTETTAEGAYIAMDRIRKAVAAEIFDYRQNPIEITLTIGLSFHHGDPSSKEIVNQADQALYRGKKNGKNQLVNYYNDVSASYITEDNPTT